LGERVDTTVEQIRRNYATTVSQMRCPYHHQDAWVEVEGGENNTFDIDIVTCCDEFEQRVRQSLMEVPAYAAFQQDEQIRQSIGTPSKQVRGIDGVPDFLSKVWKVKRLL
jgi:hypothetical protein